MFSIPSVRCLQRQESKAMAQRKKPINTKKSLYYTRLLTGVFECREKHFNPFAVLFSNTVALNRHSLPQRANNSNKIPMCICQI